ncbi:hypothetical protein E0E50_15875 [Azotobacter chroococcum subsp. isscasi]|uniref:hypothetical protein n=1 Tax=Azotobacter chroococcum TaxID=353 RepID=UPI001039A545|nr:hypothetical protein [Azotobacter chroococcum]TBW07571.1 hypothetical protein E0E50_15875 [Azotobacter chroococcum subsp. isscasi]
MANMEQTTKTITINLDHSDSNSRVDTQQLVQYACYDRIKQSISSDLEKATKNRKLHEQQDYPYGSGLVYFIDGTRGAGKSTFLQSTYHALPSSLECRTTWLGYIDPSRIEDNEIILLGILKALKDKVKKLSRAHCTTEEERKISTFREHFKKLAGGLNLFAQNHDQLRDLDAELFFEWGLERAGHSAELRKNLHSLLDNACDALNVDALILAFDDADTNARHARNVLECIRKYLDTPRLVILVTGDIELYSLMVRDHFHDNLGKAKYDQTAERMEQRERMVDHLEDQYLLKLFPMHRRLQLRPLWNLLDNKTTLYMLCHHKWGETNNRELAEVVNELIRCGLRIKTTRDLELYREFLLKQPLRSLLQVLSRCAPHLSKDDESGKKSNAWSSELSDALSESLRALALGSLYKFGIDVDAIAAHELPTLANAVFDLTIRDGDFDTGAYLRPQPSDADLKNSFAALSADVTRLCAERPAALIDYMFSGPGSVALFGQVLRRKGKDLHNREDRQTLRKQFEQYMGTGRKENALNWARHATPTLAAPYALNPRYPVILSGVIGLNRNGKSTGDRKTANSILKECDDLPAFALSLVDVSSFGTGTYASIYNILGIIARLLTLEENQRGIYDAGSILNKTYPTITVSPPQWEIDSASEDSDEADIEEDKDTPDNLKKINDHINKWLKDSSPYKKKLTPSALLIGKIWTRIHFSLEKVCDKNRPHTNKADTSRKGAAGLMELFSACVINAFYIEEQDYHLAYNANSKDDSSAKQRTNPLTSTKSFFERFKKIDTLREELPLTYIIATCPLLLGLFKETEDSLALLESLTKNSSNKKSNLLCPAKIWEEIDMAYIAGPKQ